jgi:hypothetical protein
MINSPTSAALNPEQLATLGATLDALLPPTGSFPPPSETDIVDGFILKHLPPPGGPPVYPGLDTGQLAELLDMLAETEDIPAALERLEVNQPAHFQALWALAVFGYYSRPEVTVAIQSDLACEYHGAPLPLGYAHVIAAWDADDPLQKPVAPAGRYIATSDVRRADLSGLEGGGR